MNVWKLGLAYLVAHRRTPLMLCVFALVFGAVFWAFSLPVQAVLYGAGICAVGCLFMSLADFRAFVRRHERLRRMSRMALEDLKELPPPEGLIESDYQALLETLQRQKAELVSQAERTGREAKQYYTLWAHQIKTPISQMDLILQSLPEQEARALRPSLFQIEQYVQMALYYLRSDRQGADLVIRRCPLDGIVRAAVRKYAPLIIRKKLRLSYSGTDKEVLTDEKWLQFILEQALSNAVKYTRQGQISICLEGDVLVVADTGIGIAPEDLPRVFEQGYTGYNGRENEKSTGIGLYLCKRAAGMLGHDLSIRSVPGAGTQLRIDLKDAKLEVE